MKTFEGIQNRVRKKVRWLEGEIFVSGGKGNLDQNSGSSYTHV
jgi:hypothetical protein